MAIIGGSASGIGSLLRSEPSADAQHPRSQALRRPVDEHACAVTQRIGARAVVVTSGGVRAVVVTSGGVRAAAASRAAAALRAGAAVTSGGGRAPTRRLGQVEGAVAEGAAAEGAEAEGGAHEIDVRAVVVTSGGVRAAAAARAEARAEGAVVDGCTNDAGAEGAVAEGAVAEGDVAEGGAHEIDVRAVVVTSGGVRAAAASREKAGEGAVADGCTNDAGAEGAVAEGAVAEGDVAEGGAQERTAASRSASTALAAVLPSLPARAAEASRRARQLERAAADEVEKAAAAIKRLPPCPIKSFEGDYDHVLTDYHVYRHLRVIEVVCTCSMILTTVKYAHTVLVGRAERALARRATPTVRGRQQEESTRHTTV